MNNNINDNTIGIFCLLLLFLGGIGSLYTNYHLGFFEKNGQTQTEIMTIETQIHNQELPSGIECINDLNCNNGICITDPFDPTLNECQCDDGYTDHDGDICNYRQRSQTVAVILAFVVGWTGAFWYYLSFGSGAYICLGIAQFLTCNFCCIGGIIIAILSLTNSISDGNGVMLAPFSETA